MTMIDTTQTCIIHQKHDLIGGCQATFAANGQLLFADIPLGGELPKEFDIVLDGEEFLVSLQDDGHFICPDDRDAFIAQVFG
jgi:hypothetical protein